MDLITGKILFTSLFIILIHSIETLAYAVRLSGARVKLIASGLSLFSTIVIVSRMANMGQQPLIGSIIDTAPEQNFLGFVESQFRVLIGASTIGTIIGILLLPTFIAIFSRAIIRLADTGGSVPSLLKIGLSWRSVKKVIKHLRFPRLSYLNGIKLSEIPKRLFLFNMFVTAIYTIGVLSAIYASLLTDESSRTAMMSSGLINGVATILLSIFVDPKISVMSDNVVRGKAKYTNLKGISIMMVTSRLVGTVLAQIMFIPGAYYIAWASKFFV
ncbi:MULTISPECIES: lipid II flippase Amj family protein [Cytobacillus]|uniref:lipid II flippase Amj family protein n=1 Tax=Cytobacillus TaxID=2675230 RepID=UPI00203E62A0|nr:lipid II flippase Amj family protein [Cytobacillus firmus]MCM3707280.1 lipid II flippase Amj family protein [Cytobacillus firmus]